MSETREGYKNPVSVWQSIICHIKQIPSRDTWRERDRERERDTEREDRDVLKPEDPHNNKGRDTN